jgi:PAS domain S-box-containing protein
LPSDIEYRLIVEQAPFMIWRSGIDAKCDYFNERWLSFTGRTLEQELGDGWTQGVHPDDLQRCLRTYLEAFQARTPFEMEYRMRRRDGVYRWILDRGAPCLGRSGGFEGYIGSCVDVTDRHEAQRALLVAHERELRRLRGILALCTVCKKIHNESGDWQTIDSYVRERAALDFSHGLCPACQASHYPDPDPGRPAER